MKKPKTRKIDLKQDSSSHKVEQGKRAVKVSLDQVLWAVSNSNGFPYEVAALLGVPVVTVYRWMNDHAEVKKAMQLRLATRRHMLVGDAMDAAFDPHTKNRLGWHQHAVSLLRDEEAALAKTLPTEDETDSYELSYSEAPPKKRSADDTPSAHDAPSAPSDDHDGES